VHDIDLILASASPRRLQLLRQRGFDPRVVPSGVSERPLPGEMPEDLVLRLAESKAREVRARLDRPHPALVLGADTAVVVDGSVLGKPADTAHAERMLALLSGRQHRVLTGVFLLRSDDGRHAGGVASTAVCFHSLDAATIRQYVAGGEPLDKAGAYAIQGEGARLVERIDGSWSNVVGLPLEQLDGWLARLDLAPDRLR